MSKIKDLQWKCEVTLTRKQIQQMQRLGKFVGNIETMMQDGFPSEKIDWATIRGLFHEFSRVARADTEFYKGVTEVLKGIA